MEHSPWFSWLKLKHRLKTHSDIWLDTRIDRKEINFKQLLFGSWLCPFILKIKGFKMFTFFSLLQKKTFCDAKHGCRVVGICGLKTDFSLTEGGVKCTSLLSVLLCSAF